MQIYSNSGKRLGERSKSNMAEFSSNPDERLKSDISYTDHIKRKKIDYDKRSAYRIEVNKIRVVNNLDTFINQDEFEELVDDCCLKGDELFEYLTHYLRK